MTSGRGGGPGSWREPSSGSDPRREETDFSRLGDLIPVADRPTRLPGSPSASRMEPSPDPGRLIAARWPDVVGPEVAAHARPVHLRGGRLVVTVSSSAWAQTLQMMADAIMARIGECVGPGVVEQIMFRHAGWEERSGGSVGASDHVAPMAGVEEGANAPGHEAPARPPIPLSGDQAEALAAVERLDLAPELRRRIARAMRAAFVRGEQDSVR